MRPHGPTFWHLDGTRGPLDGGGPGRSPIETFDPGARRGTYISAALDSAIHRCEWHRIELYLPQLPAGSSLRVSTFSDQVPRPAQEIRQLGDELWSEDLHLVGPMQPPPQEESGPEIQETLIHSPEGRYLWLRLRFESGGHGLPTVRWVRVHYPRQTWLEHLPSVYSSDRAGRSFLNRFLAICHTEWQKIDHITTTARRYVDPAAVPPGAAMDYLASWLGQRFEETWDGDRKRRLLKLLPSYLPRRGTPAALRRILGPYLDAPTGSQNTGFPRIVEGFRERRYLAATGEREGRLGASRPLWSEAGRRRLRLDRGARLDDGMLVSNGDPRLDSYTVHAHRFRVFVPAAWVPGRAEERQLRRGLEGEKPAHTLAQLCLVEPRLRVGLQATVGLDTIVGAVPRARLADACHPPNPTRALRQRLGWDSVLACGGSGDLP